MLQVEDGFIDLSLKTIAKESGLGLRRCQRAVAWLKKAGLIALAEPVRPTPFPGLKPGSHDVVRIVNPDFLRNLIFERVMLALNPPAADPEGQP